MLTVMIGVTLGLLGLVLVVVRLDRGHLWPRRELTRGGRLTWQHHGSRGEGRLSDGSPGPRGFRRQSSWRYSSASWAPSASRRTFERSTRIGLAVSGAAIGGAVVRLLLWWRGTNDRV